MVESSADKVRSFTLLGASGSGKTSLAEALLFRAQAIHRLGKVDDGTSQLDSDPEEHKRKISLFSKVQSLSWKDYRLHLADTPGFPDFLGEVLAPLQVMDAAVLVIDATVGVDVSARLFFKEAMRLKKPVLIFLNKFDKAQADFERCLDSIRNNLSRHAFPIALPLGNGAGFRGVLDLVDGRALEENEKGVKEIAIPWEEQEKFQDWQKKLIEEVAETDEALFEKLGNGEVLKKEDILPSLMKDIEEEEIIPILVGSSLGMQGVSLLLETATHLLLPPAQLPESRGKNPTNGLVETRKGSLSESPCAQVFKIQSDPGMGDLYFLKIFSGKLMHGQDLLNGRSMALERCNHLFKISGRERHEVAEAFAGDVVAVAKLKASQVGDTLSDASRPFALEAIHYPNAVLSKALHPKTRQDQEKLGIALGKLTALDPTFHFHHDAEFSETLVSGMGEVHLEVMLERLQSKYGIALELCEPHVPYRETIVGRSEVQGKYKKQTGGHGQYGDVWIRMSPSALGHGFTFVDGIKGGVIPSKYIPAVEKGIREAMHRGVLAGYPVVDFQVELYDGSFHNVDSSDLAFQIAGSMAFKKAEEEAHPILLEPVMRVEILTPVDYVGAITNDLASRRGKILGMDQEGDLQVIQGEVPMAELFSYATDLRGLTHGSGSHRAEFARYEAVPGNLLSKVLKEKSRLIREEKK